MIELLKKRHGHFADVIRGGCVISECSIYQHSEGKWSGRGDTPERRKKNDFQDAERLFKQDEGKKAVFLESGKRRLTPAMGSFWF